MNNAIGRRLSTQEDIATKDSQIPWSTLTLDQSKLAYYFDEVEPRLGWEILEKKFSNKLFTFLMTHTFIVIKPETFRLRLLMPIVELLAKNGFEILLSHPFFLSSSISRLIWRYQWNAATTERIWLSGEKNDHYQSLFLLLRDANTMNSEVPCTLRLYDIKGSSKYLANRKPNQIRSIIKSTNRSLTHIHCPDEPADFLRELAILILDDYKFAQEVLAHAETDNKPISASSLTDFENMIATHSVDFNEVANRRSELPVRELGTMKQTNGEAIPLTAVRQAFGAISSEAEQWDFVTIASNLIAHDLDNVEPLVSTREMPRIFEQWRHEYPKLKKLI